MDRRPLAQLARGDKLAFLADERAVVDAELHLKGRRVDLGEGEGVAVLVGVQRVADVDVLEAGDADDVAGVGFGDLALAETGWHNYSLFLRPDGLLIGYFETESLEAAQAGMAQDAASNSQHTRRVHEVR